MKIGIIGSGNIGGTAARLFAAAGHEVALSHKSRRDDSQAKEIVSRLVEEIGFAPVDTGGLRDGGRLQQPGSPLFTRHLTGAEARAAIRAALTGAARSGEPTQTR
jgi:predicted dinucleotide-binding enzyme